MVGMGVVVCMCSQNNGFMRTEVVYSAVVVNLPGTIISINQH